MGVKSQGLPPGQSAQLVNMTENPLRDSCQLYLDGGVERLKEGALPGPERALPAHSASGEADLRAPPPATSSEAQKQIQALPGIKRSETQG